METELIDIPANLPPEALAMQERYLQAKTVEERIRYLEKYLSLIPKHKGTENLRANVKTRLAKLRRELEERKVKRRVLYSKEGIKKTGSIRMSLIGFSNSGKSSIMKALTSANVEVSDVPFSTREPTPGMFFYENGKIQLIEIPSTFLESSRIAKKFSSVIRSSDGLIIVLDLSSDPSDQLKKIIEKIEEIGVKINVERPKVKIKRLPSGGIQVTGEKLFKGEKEQIYSLLREMGYINVSVEIKGEVTPEQFAEALDENMEYKKAVLIANKGDLPGTLKRYEGLLEKIKGKFRVIPASALKGKFQGDLGELLLNELNLIKIYTKPPRKEPSNEPIFMPQGSNIKDLAKKINKTMVKSFEYARVWGKSVKHGGERVSLDHKLEDGDIVEIHYTLP